MNSKVKQSKRGSIKNEVISNDNNLINKAKKVK